MTQLSWRKMLVVDFCCALAGAFIYFILLNVLIEELGMPRWMALSQLAANFLYGVYGISIFLSKTQNPLWFRSLIFANIIYAVFCAVLGLSLFSEQQVAALILAVEALLIIALAKFEWRSLSKQLSRLRPEEL